MCMLRSDTRSLGSMQLCENNNIFYWAKRHQNSLITVDQRKVSFISPILYMSHIT